eukprot:g67957.t1
MALLRLLLKCQLEVVYFAMEVEFEGEAPLRDQVRMAAFVLSLISAVVCGLVLTMAAFANLHASAYLHLSVNLIAASFLQAISWAWSAQAEECQVPGFFKLFSEVASLMFITSMSVSIYWMMFHPDQRFSRLEFQYVIARRIIIACWGISLLVALGALWIRSFGQETYWCWISEDFLLVRFAMFDVIMALGLSIMIWVVVMLRLNGVKLSSPSAYRGDRDLSSVAYDLSSKMMLKALVFFICQVWGLLDDIIDATKPENAHYVEIPSAFITPLYGSLVSLLFVADFQSVLPWRRRKQESRYRSEHDTNKSATENIASPSGTVARQEGHTAMSSSGRQGRPHSRPGSPPRSRLQSGNSSQGGQANDSEAEREVRGDKEESDSDSESYSQFEQLEIQFIVEEEEGEDEHCVMNDELRLKLQKSLGRDEIEPADLDSTPRDSESHNSSRSFWSGEARASKPPVQASSTPKSARGTRDSKQRESGNGQNMVERASKQRESGNGQNIVERASTARQTTAVDSGKSKNHSAPEGLEASSFTTVPRESSVAARFVSLRSSSATRFSVTPPRSRTARAPSARSSRPQTAADHHCANHARASRTTGKLKHGPFGDTKGGCYARAVGPTILRLVKKMSL